MYSRLYNPDPIGVALVVDGDFELIIPSKNSVVVPAHIGEIAQGVMHALEVVPASEKEYDEFQEQQKAKAQVEAKDAKKAKAKAEVAKEAEAAQVASKSKAVAKIQANEVKQAEKDVAERFAGQVSLERKGENLGAWLPKKARKAKLGKSPKKGVKK